MSEDKELLYRDLDKLFRNYPNIEIKEVKSLTKLREEFGIGKDKIIDWVDEYLYKKFEYSTAKRIKQKLWPKKSTILNQYKKDQLFEILKIQIKNYYPNNIYKISSLSELKSLIKVRRTTITEWVKQFLEIKYNLIKGEEIFNKIWTSRKESRHIAITYHYLRDFVKNRYGTLITTEEAFNSMKEIPTSRYIQIRCEKNHDFEALVLHILYHHQWCPRCNEYFCQKIMRLYMEEIFQAKFPETSLNRAFGISYHEGGKLRFDGYNENIHINRKILRIAFEYDGIQHDRFPNSFHRTIEEFDRQKENDKKKKKKAKQFSTVLIKLKEINRFNSNTISNFQREILKQFYRSTGIRLKYRPLLEYNPYLDTIVPRKDNFDQWITKDKKEEEDKTTRDPQASDDSKEKDKDIIYKENKEEHPFDRRFNEVEEEDDFNDQYLWISPKVRENIEKKKEKLLEKAKERIIKKIDSLSSGELESDSKHNDYLSEKNSSSNDLLEKQPLINPEISSKGITPHQEGGGTDIIPNYNLEISIGESLEQLIEEPPEVPIEEPPEVPIEEPPEVPIEEPPEVPIEEPPEVPIEEPPEVPIEEPPELPIEELPEVPIVEPPEIPIEEPPEVPIEEPLEEHIEEPIEQPPEGPIGGETPIEEIIGAISDISVFHSSFQSPNSDLQNQAHTINNNDIDKDFDGSTIRDYDDNFDDDIDKDFDGSTIRDYGDNFDDDIDKNFDGSTIRDYGDNFDDDIDKDFDGSIVRDYDDNYNSSDDPISYINIGDYAPEAEAYSSYGYSDCPDDCPSE